MSVDYSSADIGAAVDAFHHQTTDWYVPTERVPSAAPSLRPALTPD